MNRPRPRRLFLLRHAKSSWGEPELADVDRPLNKRGMKDAPEVGRRLAAYGCRPDLWLASPAKRTWETALCVRDALEGKVELRAEPRLYGASREDWQEIVRAFPEEWNEVVCVGHNPALTEFAEWLTGSVLANVPTGGVVCAQLGRLGWQDMEAGVAECVWFDYPKLHR